VEDWRVWPEGPEGAEGLAAGRAEERDCEKKDVDE
jgi:hypothetical protein